MTGVQTCALPIFLSKGGKDLYTISTTSPKAIAVNPVNDIVDPHPAVLEITSGGAIKLNINDRSSGWKLEAGAYTLKVKVNNKEVSKTLVVTDTQPKVEVRRVKTTSNSVKDCFEIYYDGKKQDSPTVNYYNAAKPAVNVTENAGTVSISYAIVTIDLGNGNSLTQKVNIGLTVRVE